MNKTTTTIIFAMIMLIMSISFASAYPVVFRITGNRGTFNTDVYRCSDQNCNSMSTSAYSTDSGNPNQYTITGSGTQYFGEFNYMDCYLPQGYVATTHSTTGQGPWDYSVDFVKANSCTSNINSVTESNSGVIQIGQQKTYTVNVRSAFNDNGVPPNTIPANIVHRYSSDVKVELFVNSVLVDSDDIDIYMDSNEVVSLQWTPSVKGDYSIEIRTTVPDCSCASDVSRHWYTSYTIPNNAPAANDVSKTTDEDSSVLVTFDCSDTDGDSLSYNIVSDPSHGTLSGSGSSRTYTPASGYSGADSFTYRCYDGEDYSNTATASITINDVICNDNNDCGTQTVVDYCSGLDFVTATTTPTCYNAGTSLSYCSDVVSETNESCNNICDDNLGCDYTECSDGVDNDNDGDIDYPVDAACDDYYDDNETGVIVCTTDLDCGDPLWDCSCRGLLHECGPITPTCFEAGTDKSYCQDIFDMTTEICNNICTPYLGCDYTQCSDGSDNDGDQFIDFPNDPGCEDYYDEDEYNNLLPTADLSANVTLGMIDLRVRFACNVTVGDAPADVSFDFGDNSGADILDLSVDGIMYATNIYTAPGTYNVSCTVTDDDGDSVVDNVIVTVNPTECSDGIDNDNDSYVDSFDPGCHTDGNPNNNASYDLYDNNESDGGISCYVDLDCGDVYSYNECNNLAFTNVTMTPTCMNPGTLNSYCNVVPSEDDEICNNICDDTLGCDYTECSDGVDNDNDSTIDYPSDLGCDDYYDDDESDGTVTCINDLDCGTVDVISSCTNLFFTVQTTTPTCNNAGTEQSYCSDIIDYNTTTCNNICDDGLGCDYTQCSDGLDNDGDGDIDYPADVACDDYYDDNETGTIGCFSNSECGSLTYDGTCSGLTYFATIYDPICYNAGTEASYCANDTTVISDSCNYICDDSLGCDYTQCSDGLDNDFDTIIDYPADPGCDDYLDDDERDVTCNSNSECGDGYVTWYCDGLTYTTETFVPTCQNPGSVFSYCVNDSSFHYESCNNICDNVQGCDYTQCSDTVDNDGDYFIDYPSDLGCVSYYDDDEGDGSVACNSNSECGIQYNITSCAGLTHYLTVITPTCTNPGSEYSYCSDDVDITAESCNNICSYSEGCDYTECSDGSDNDLDTFIDYPLDTGCISYYDDNESDGPIDCYVNSDCGAVSSTSVCNGLIYNTTNTIPTCYNGGTEQSYCGEEYSYSDETCSNICDDSLGCDYTECSDGSDNDLDTFIDYPLDAGCVSYQDDDESDGAIACNNDFECGGTVRVWSCDGLTYSELATFNTCNNAGTEQSYCSNSVAYYNESCSNICDDSLGCDYTQCSDGSDNDGDGDIDYPADSACDDYYDDDEQGAINCTADIDCGNVIINGSCTGLVYNETVTSPVCMNSGTEQSYCSSNVTAGNNDVCDFICSGGWGCDYTQCSDSADNDLDGFIDFPADPGCHDYYDDFEGDGTSQCQDGSDNDNDGLIDMMDPGCSAPYDDNESDGTTQCQDGADNDSDGLIDMEDPGCDSPLDDDESDGTSECQDGIDNDNDGLIDMNDPGCDNATDDDESNLFDLYIDNGYIYDEPIYENESAQIRFHTHNVPVVANSVSVEVYSDGELLSWIETLPYPSEDYDWGIVLGYLTPGMHNLTVITDANDSYMESDEGNNVFEFIFEVFEVTALPECNDGNDNDGDGLVDMNDPGCSSSTDDDESDGTSQCQDGVDNDADGLTDMADPGCSSPQDNNESDGTSQCQDGVDNDADGLVDMVDPGCSSSTDDNESDGTSACQDGLDNDGDGLIDLADPGCENPQDDGEFNYVEVSEPITDADLVIERMSINGDYSDGEVYAGDVIFFAFDFRNRGDTDFDNLRLKVSIPELGISRRLGPFELDEGDDLHKTVSLDIPYYSEPGEYLVRAVLFDEEAKRVQHRYVTIN